jgi:hypothetical protein
MWEVKENMGLKKIPVFCFLSEGLWCVKPEVMLVIWQALTLLTYLSSWTLAEIDIYVSSTSASFTSTSVYQTC